MIITSIIPGRLRIRDQHLCRSDRAEQLRSDLLAMDGIDEVTVSPRTGSLLICCSSTRETMQEIMAFLGKLLGEAEDTGQPGAGLFAPTSRLHRNSVNLGMIISLLTSLIGVALGAETLHIAAGVLFLATLSIHLFERRRQLYIGG